MDIPSFRRVRLGTAALAGLALCCTAAASLDPGATPPNPFPGNSALSLDRAVTPPNQFEGFTAPSEKRAQNFDTPGVVQELKVKEGDTVKAGELLAQQDIAADEQHLKGLQIIANSTLEIEAEQAQLKMDEVDLERNTKLIAKQAISQGEYDKAKLAVTFDNKKLAKAYEDQQKAKYDVAETEAHIRQKQLLAKIDGVVSEINTHEGELANSDTQHPTITIVQNNPLYVEVDIPSSVVRQLKSSSDQLQVHYLDDTDPNSWHNAKIHFIKPEGDPRSNTEHVQLEMTNAENRPSGLQVMVKVPASLVPGGSETADAASTGAGR